MIKKKFKKYFEAKELWKALKSLDLPSKKGTISHICLNKDGKICFDDKATANVFQECFCNLARNLVSKLSPSPSNRFTNRFIMVTKGCSDMQL